MSIDTAYEMMIDIYAAQSSKEVSDAYNDVIVKTTTIMEGEESIMTTVYSLPNNYYSMEGVGFAGVYPIDGLTTYVVISEEGNSSSTSEEDINGFIDQCFLDVAFSAAFPIVLGSNLLKAAHDEGNPTEEGYYLHCHKVGDNGLNLDIEGEGESYIISFENNLPTRYYQSFLDSGQTVSVDILFSYGTSEEDRPIRRP